MKQQLAVAALLVACGRHDSETAPQPLDLTQADVDLLTQLTIAPMVMLGDVDGDHVLTSTDVAAMRAGGELACPQAGDWDWSGALEASDADVSQAVLAGLLPGEVLALPLVPLQYLPCQTPRPVASRDRAAAGTSVPMLLLAGNDYVDVRASGNATVRVDPVIERLRWIDIPASATGWATVDLFRRGATIGSGSAGSGSGSATIEMLPERHVIYLDASAEAPIIERVATAEPTLHVAPTVHTSHTGGDAGTSGGDGGGGDGGGGDGGSGTTPDAGTPPPPPPPEPCNAEGRGCVVLLVDYHDSTEATVFPPPVNLMRSYRDRGCEIFEWSAVTHKVRQPPTPMKLDHIQIFDNRGRLQYETWRHPTRGHRLSQSERRMLQAEFDAAYAAQRTKHDTDMRAAATERDRTIQRYRDRVSQMAEDVYEIVVAHGSNRAHPRDTSGTSCGVWTSSFWWRSSAAADYSDATMRGPFVQGNYDAANKRVCTRTMFDGSCYSGLGVIANAYANNAGAALCPETVDAQDYHPAHAGDRGDAAYGACGVGLCYADEARDMLVAARLGTLGMHTGSSYTDGGYNHCEGNSLVIRHPSNNRVRTRRSQ